MAMPGEESPFRTCISCYVCYAGFYCISHELSTFERLSVTYLNAMAVSSVKLSGKRRMPPLGWVGIGLFG